jgi:hypothetical protein
LARTRRTNHSRAYSGTRGTRRRSRVLTSALPSRLRYPRHYPNVTCRLPSPRMRRRAPRKPPRRSRREESCRRGRAMASAPTSVAVPEDGRREKRGGVTPRRESKSQVAYVRV